jgi:nitroreductase
MDNANIRATDSFVTDRLEHALTVAGRAPSIHNTQPWRWRVRGNVADLYADTRRQLVVVDPDRRLLTVSCGAALHHASTALAADGIGAAVDLTPSKADPTHLARITVTGRTPVTDAAVRLFHTIQIRHTDRRPLLDESIRGSDVAAMRTIVGEYGTGLHPISRTDVLELAAATARAQRDEIDDAAAQRELDAWTGDNRPVGAGVPDANILSEPSRTTVPSRDFGHPGAVPTTSGHDKSAMYAILYGPDDEPTSWLQAGRALSALWLYAVAHNIAVLPLSAAVEEAFTRQKLHRMLAGLGYAQLAVRLGIADPNQEATPHTPRLPASETITILG